MSLQFLPIKLFYDQSADIPIKQTNGRPDQRGEIILLPIRQHIVIKLRTRALYANAGPNLLIEWDGTNLPVMKPASVWRETDFFTYANLNYSRLSRCVSQALSLWIYGV